MTLLTVRDLSVRIGTDGPAIVDAISFDLAEGEAFGLVGESGCGKTTLARALLGLLPKGLIISTGSIRFRGTELVGLRRSEMNRLRWKEIALVTQSAMNALDPVMRVGEQIAEAIQTHFPMDKRTALRCTETLLAQVSLDPSLARRYPHEFSGGMRQRAIIAMALACDPSLIIADEPTTALDVITQDAVFALLARAREDGGRALLLVSHDLSVISENCHRVAVMYAGRVVEIGPTTSVFSKPGHPYTIGLQRAFPALEGTLADLVSIPGAPPPPAIESPSCRFVLRCPFARPVCRNVIPAMAMVDDGHWVACHFVNEAARFRTEGGCSATWEPLDALRPPA